MEPDIRQALNNSSIVLIRHVQQSESEREDNEADVAQYVSHLSRKMDPPLTEDHLRLLTKRSGSLFIFAATACTIIAKTYD
jgi:hypothetical protein